MKIKARAAKVAQYIIISVVLDAGRGDDAASNVQIASLRYVYIPVLIKAL